MILKLENVNVAIQNTQSTWTMKILIKSKKVSFDKKRFRYFIGYKENEKIKPLYIKLPNDYPNDCIC